MTNTPHTNAPAYQAFDSAENKQYHSGDTIIDFRGTHWGFIAVTRGPSEGCSAKVKVSDGLGGTREFYSNVFPGLEVI
jgi:hypothetical protein